MSAAPRSRRDAVSRFVTANTARICDLEASNKITDREAQVAREILEWLRQVAGLRAPGSGGDGKQ